MCRWFAALVLTATVVATCRAAETPRVPEKWFYYPGTVATAQDTDAFIGYIRQAKAAGYTHIMFDEVYLQTARDMSKEWFDNTARAKKAAEEAGIIIIPTIFNVGYSWRVLYYDSNLAGGLPARDVPFKVSGMTAAADPAGAPKVVNGGFEIFSGHLAGWQMDEGVCPCITLDTEEKHSGDSSLRLSDFGNLAAEAEGDCSLAQLIEVDPFKYYRLTIWRKTEDLDARSSTIYIGSADGKRRLSYTNFEIDPVQDWEDFVARDSDWRQFQLTFNTLESTAIIIRVGLEGAKSGAAWWDDLKLEPAGLANVLRADTTPVKVTSADGKAVYEEGKDFERIEDPKLGMGPMMESFNALPRSGGSYDIWHEGPVIRLTEGSRIKDGETILVSYFHPHVIYGHQVTCSLVDPKVFDLFREQMKWIKDLWNAPTYVMVYDEIRIGGWEEQPGGTNYSTAELLGRHIAKAYEIFHEAAPEAKAYVWSDMFDPYHNARKLENSNGYYLCKGDFYGTWEWLPKEMGILKWGGSTVESSKFFGERGHTVILSGELGRVGRLVEAAKAVPQVVGFMYTIWTKDYSGMEEYSKKIDEGMAAEQ